VHLTVSRPARPARENGGDAKGDGRSRGGERREGREGVDEPAHVGPSCCVMERCQAWVTQGVKRCLAIQWSVLVPLRPHRCTLTATRTLAGFLMLLLGTARSR